MVPWPIKIAAKIVLARVPMPREIWNRLGMFRHGPNAQAEYAYSVFSKHFAAAQPPAGFTMLELGPGDALASAVLTPAFGGSASIQVDVAPFARGDLEIYRRMAQLAVQRGRDLRGIDDAHSLDDVLHIYGARYLTQGLQSLKSIPTGSVDFIYSHAALEHVRAGEFEETVHEIRRIMSPMGVASHQVDLRDHLADSLNNLRFPDKIWEAPLMAESGFYTNRISYSEMLEVFERAGFTIEVLETQRWEKPPVARSALSGRFRNRSEEDMTIKGFHVLCRRTDRSPFHGELRGHLPA